MLLLPRLLRQTLPLLLQQMRVHNACRKDNSSKQLGLYRRCFASAGPGHVGWGESGACLLSSSSSSSSSRGWEFCCPLRDGELQQQRCMWLCVLLIAPLLPLTQPLLVCCRSSSSNNKSSSSSSRKWRALWKHRGRQRQAPSRLLGLMLLLAAPCCCSAHGLLLLVLLQLLLQTPVPSRC